MELKRVVVTGLGAVTPLGNNPEDTWQAMLEGKSGAAPITQFDTTQFKTHFACEVKGFDPKEYLDRKEYGPLYAVGYGECHSGHQRLRIRLRQGR